MANFACVLCERTYVHKRNLVQHVKMNHTDGKRQEARNHSDGESLPIKTGLGFKCDQCGRVYMHRRSLDRHVSRNHIDNPTFNCKQCGKSYARSGNAGDVVSEFVVRKTRKSLRGKAEMFTVDMKGANHLSALQGVL